MKHFLPGILCLIIFLLDNSTQAQTKNDTATRLLRISEDNDFINFYMRGTDNAYTNGTRFDFFYTKRHPSHFFVDRIMPKAGRNSVNTYGWSIAQIMYTPNNLATTYFQPDDYPYAGQLYGTHSLYSYNPSKKFDLQTEIIFGVSGPSAFTRQSQTFVHRLINYQEPMGWRYQANDRLLLNLNLSAEKQLAAAGKWFELIGGSQVSLGTMINSLSIYQEIRIGKMPAYFSGFINQYSVSSNRRHKFQAYVFAKSLPLYVLSNELLQREAPYAAFNNSKDENPANPSRRSYHEINHLVYYFSYGGVISSGHFSISVAETSDTALMKDLYSHEFGNISLYFSW